MTACIAVVGLCLLFAWAASQSRDGRTWSAAGESAGTAAGTDSPVTSTKGDEQ